MCKLISSVILTLCLVVTLSKFTYVTGNRYAGYYGFHEFPIEPELPSSLAGLTNSHGTSKSTNEIHHSSSNYSPPGPINFSMFDVTPHHTNSLSDVKKTVDSTMSKIFVPTYLDNEKNVPELQQQVNDLVDGKSNNEKEKSSSFLPKVNSQQHTQGTSNESSGKVKESLHMPSIPPVPSFPSVKVPTSDDKEKYPEQEDLSSYHGTEPHLMKPIKTNHSTHLPRRPQLMHQESPQNQEPHQHQQQQQEPQLTHPSQQYTSRHRPSPYGSRHKNIRIFDYDYDIAYRSDFYWLIPLVIIIGIGALLLPLCSLFMTAMVSNGAINFTGKRRKRSPNDSSINPFLSGQLLETLLKVDTAIEILKKAFDRK